MSRILHLDEGMDAGASSRGGGRDPILAAR